MKKSSDIAAKVYDILFEKCKNDFEEKTWREWHVFLRDQDIESKGFDNYHDHIEEMMKIVNDRTDMFVVCSDPWVNVAEEYGCDGFLIIPIEVAEKILVLQGVA